MSAVLQQPYRSRMHRLVGSPLLRPFNDLEAIDGVLAGINRLWSLRHARARVLEVIEETADTRTFVLKPNRHWQGAQAGQHVTIGLDIDGTLHQRVFSLSAPAPRGVPLRLTIKRQPGGHVTGWMHDHLRPQAVVALGAAQGRFVLPQNLPDRVLMLGAGSGITPLHAMLLSLRERGYTGDVVLVHASRDADDAILGEPLRRLARQWRALTVISHYSARWGRLDAATLAERVPDHLQRLTLMCGPSALMEWMDALYGGAGAQGRLLSERFGLPRRAQTDAGQPAQVHCTVSERVFTADTVQPLLAAAESQGLRPRYGCRIGICKTCQCRKRSGAVENLLTGEISSTPGELIQLCISAARSDLELEL